MGVRRHKSEVPVLALPLTCGGILSKSVPSHLWVSFLNKMKISGGGLRQVGSLKNCYYLMNITDPRKGSLFIFFWQSISIPSPPPSHDPWEVGRE